MSGSDPAENPAAPAPITPVAAPAPTPRDWLHRVLTGLVLVAALVAVYFAAAAFIPRWWANRIGHSVNGQLSTGALLGFCFGAVFTILPLGLLWITLRRYRSWKVLALWLALAVLLAAPNLMTLGVTIGSGSGSHAGPRTMDVLAPMFRGATLIGALFAVVVFVALVIAFRRRIHRAEVQPQPTSPAQPPDAPPVDPPPADSPPTDGPSADSPPADEPPPP
ncbi:MAG: permease [Catenulispora sp.]|nr:permease [Catenulispora sp.]